MPDVIADISIRNYIRRLGNALAKKKGVRYPNGFSIVKAGEDHRAAKWEVTSLEKADSLQSSFNYESDESSLIRQRMGKNKDTLNNVYKSGGEVDSQDSPLGTKQGESGPGELPKCIKESR